MTRPDVTTAPKRLHILDDGEIEALYGRPCLNGDERTNMLFLAGNIRPTRLQEKGSTSGKPFRRGSPQRGPRRLITDGVPSNSIRSSLGQRKNWSFSAGEVVPF
ncbi:hypothetical protein EPA93_16725 [Ktedonosporobacter rubrisoli]|uniref:Uncharacterized protein n=1 Tax=Ktedonosporobacter rubrisoli TaxID=2509675 RepID=A0A4P6JQE3_KTERU|nr:hypothetical protein [Ktedonosporobacter rubrisoli]QBD77545.1 hypothetical protein EPA93_16725 [Ktedonosporobacter rubrisoli]